MDTITYAIYLEKKLVKQFKDRFYDKMGYFPVVNTLINNDEQLPKLDLIEMKEYFDTIVPTVYKEGYTIDSQNRYKPIVELRTIYCSIARKMGYSLIQIATSLGKKDHTTIINSLENCKKMIVNNPEFRMKYTSIYLNVQNLKSCNII